MTPHREAIVWANPRDRAAIAWRVGVDAMARLERQINADARELEADLVDELVAACRRQRIVWIWRLALRFHYQAKAGLHSDGPRRRIYGRPVFVSEVNAARAMLYVADRAPGPVRRAQGLGLIEVYRHAGVERCQAFREFLFLFAPEALVRPEAKP